MHFGIHYIKILNTCYYSNRHNRQNDMMLGTSAMYRPSLYIHLDLNKRIYNAKSSV